MSLLYQSDVYKEDEMSNKVDMCSKTIEEIKATIKDMHTCEGTKPVSSRYEFHECDSGALKHQVDKNRLELVPPEAIEAMGRVLTYGASKYADRNWSKGIPYMTTYASAMRHMLSWSKGIDVDEESGQLHIEMALTNLAMMVTQVVLERDDLDDRYTGG